MPKIPFAPKPDAPRHVSDAVPMSGAPGMNFKMEEGEALRQFGKSLGEAGRAVGGAMTDFAEKLTDTSNQLAAAEAQSLYTKQSEELRTRMAQNPFQYKEFAKWSRDNETAFDEAAKPILERMSPNFRKLFEARMSGVRARQSGEFKRVGTQAQISVELERYKKLKAEYAKTGNAAAYKALVEYHRGVLISKEQADLDMLDYHRLAESAEAGRLIAADPETALKKLQERGGTEGDFVNFKHLPQDYRKSLIRDAAVGAAKKQNEFLEGMAANFHENGQLLYSDEKLTEMHRNGEISDELYNHAMRYNARFQQEMSGLRSKQESAANARLDQEIAAFTIKNLYDEKGREKILTAGEADLVCKQARELCGAHYKKYLDLVRTIRASAAAAQKGDDPWKTLDGKQVLRFLKSQDLYYNAGPLKKGWFGGEKRVPFDLKSKEFKENINGTRGDGYDFTDAYAAAQELEMYRTAETMLEQGKTAPEIIERMTNAVDSIHAGYCRTILEYLATENSVRSFLKRNGETEKQRNVPASGGEDGKTEKTEGNGGNGGNGPASGGEDGKTEKSTPEGVSDRHAQSMMELSGLAGTRLDAAREGQKGRHKNGRTVIYRNGAWHYEQ